MFASTGPGSASGPCGGRRSSPWGALPRIRTSNLSYASSFHAARTQQDEHWPLGPGAVISKEQRDCGSISKYQRSSHGGGTSEALGTASAPMPMLPTGGSALPRVPIQPEMLLRATTRQPPSEHQVPPGTTTPTLSVHVRGDKETPGWWAGDITAAPGMGMFSSGPRNSGSDVCKSRLRTTNQEEEFNPFWAESRNPRTGTVILSAGRRGFVKS